MEMFLSNVYYFQSYRVTSSEKKETSKLILQEGNMHVVFYVKTYSFLYVGEAFRLYDGLLRGNVRQQLKEVEEPQVEI